MKIVTIILHLFILSGLLKLNHISINSGNQDVISDIQKDTTLANKYFEKGEDFVNRVEYDSAITCFEKALGIYKKLYSDYHEEEAAELLDRLARVLDYSVVD